MKMLVVFVILMLVSQHAFAVEVNSGAESVLLPCQISFVPQGTTVVWSRQDLDPSTVHKRLEVGDDLKDQNQRYSRRTSMKTEALKTGDFSLNLRKPRLSDNGNYTCTATMYGEEQRLAEVQLEVKVSFKVVAVEVYVGVKSVLLPCMFHFVSEDTTVVWSRNDLSPSTVHQHYGTVPKAQNQRYRGRTSMRPNALRTGDLSLNLTEPNLCDSSTYTCSIAEAGEERRVMEVQLKVKELYSFPVEAWVLLIVLIILLVVIVCLVVYMRRLKNRVQQVVVDSGVESVVLLCKIRVHLSEDITVEWRDRYNRKVHVYQNGSDQPGEQDWFYRGRTEMKRNLQEPGDLSLTLKYPTDGDRGTFTCIVYRRKGKLLKEKMEVLVKVQQVEVDSGVESVLLPCKTTVQLDEDVRVEWMDRDNKKVHVNQNGSDQPGEQIRSYRGRTEMKRPLLNSGDLSVTLKYPTDGDSNIYTCTVYSREGNILMKKDVELKVKVCQVEVEEGVESVLLPFRTTGDMHQDGRVEWERYEPKYMMVHKYENGFDHPEEQDQFYRNRTEMKKDLLKNGDLSLILKIPKITDSGRYICEVYRKGLLRSISRKKTVLLKVKERIQDQTVDIRNRSSSTDPTPLIADQPV